MINKGWYLKGSVAALLVVVMSLSACVSRGAYAGLQDQLTGTQQQLSEEKSEVARLSSALSLEETRANDLASQMTSLGEQLSKERQNASNLEGELSLAKSTNTGLGQQVSELNSEVAQARSTNTGLTQQVNTLKSEITQARDSNIVLYQQIDSLKAELSQARSPLASKDTAILSVTSQNLGDNLVLTYEPAQPVTGRPIRFGLQGLSPWTPVTLSIVDPGGNPVDWTDEDEVLTPETETRYADGTGYVSWARLNGLDAEGQWTVQLQVEGKTYSVKYTLAPLQFQTVTISDLGVSLRRYSGSSSDVYSSGGVPLSLALDLSGMLPSIGERLKPWLGLSSVQIPDIYLFSNSELFKTAVLAAGGNVSGLEAGMYRPSGKYKGIYIIANPFTSETIKTLIHEYAHLLVDEMTPGSGIPAWLNEGLATYLELHSAQGFSPGLSAGREVFSKADRAKDYLARDALLPLNRLVSQRDWNAQADRELSQLQYSEAYMSVRYLLERFGNQTAAGILHELNAGQSVDAAFQKVTGLSLTAFEKDWLAWLRNWQDPSREQVRQYISQVDAIMQGISALSGERSNFLKATSSAPSFSRVSTGNQFASRATALESNALALSPPASLTDFHAGLTAFVSLYKRWLQRELDAAIQESNTLVDQANAMIPEVNGRNNRLRAQLLFVRFDWQISTVRVP